MGADRWDEQVGSVADEVARLLESLRRSVEDPAPAAGGAPADAGSGAAAPVTDGPTGAPTGDRPPGGAGATSQTHGGQADAQTHDPFCAWCPLCRSAAVLRTLSPETLTRLADLAGVAATVLADLASTRAAGTTEGTSAAGDPRRPRAPESRPIPVHDADDPQEAPRG